MLLERSFIEFRLDFEIKENLGYMRSLRTWTFIRYIWNPIYVTIFQWNSTIRTKLWRIWNPIYANPLYLSFTVLKICISIIKRNYFIVLLHCSIVLCFIVQPFISNLPLRRLEELEKLVFTKCKFVYLRIRPTFPGSDNLSNRIFAASSSIHVSNTNNDVINPSAKIDTCSKS